MRLNVIIKTEFIHVLIIFSAILSGCASSPYPYHDAAGNDKNRAPASLGIPSEATESSNLKKVNEQSEVDYLFLKSDIDSNSGNNLTAIEGLKTAIQLDPESITLKQRLAIEYYKKGQITDSIYWLSKALEKKPDSKDLLLLYGSMLMTKKEYEKSEVIYQKLIKLYPKDPEAYLYLGALYSEKGDFSKSYQSFSRVIKFGTFEPKHLPYYYRARIVVESKKKNKYNQAKKDLEKSFEIKPDFLESIQVYSNLLLETKGKESVIAFYISHQKKYGPIHRLSEVLAQHYIEKDMFDKAFEQLEFLEDSSDDVVQVKLKMALILIDKKNYEKALIKLEELYALVPESDKVLFYLGAVYEELKKPDLAIQKYLNVQKSSQQYDDARIRAALIIKNQGDLKKSLSVAKEALKNKTEIIQLYLLVAQLEDESKNYSESIDTLKKADIKFPKNSQIQYYIGTIFDKLNKKTEMLQYMKLAVKYDSKNHQALNYLAYSLSESNQNLDEAEKYALAAYELQSDDAFIVDTLGWVYYKKGHYSKAVTYLEKAHDLSPEVGVIAEHLGDAYLKLKKEEKAKLAYLKAKKEEKDEERIKQLNSKITSIEETNLMRTPASEVKYSP